MICELHITLMSPALWLLLFSHNTAKLLYVSNNNRDAGVGAREQGCAYYQIVHENVKNGLFEPSQRAAEIGVSFSGLICSQGLQHQTIMKGGREGNWLEGYGDVLGNPKAQSSYAGPDQETRKLSGNKVPPLCPLSLAGLW